MDNGLINDHVYPSNASGTCPTDHCTWDPYTTLGVSVTIEDVTNLLESQPDMPALVPQDKHSFERTDPYYLNKSTFMVDTRWIFDADYPTPAVSDGRLPDLANIYLSYYDPCLNTNSDLDWRALKYWRGFKASFKFSLLRLNSTFTQSMNTEIKETQDSLPWNSSLAPSAAGLVERRLFCAQDGQSPDDFCVRSDKLTTIGEQLDWAINPYNVRIKLTYGS